MKSPEPEQGAIGGGIRHSAEQGIAELHAQGAEHRIQQLNPPIQPSQVDPLLCGAPLQIERLVLFCAVCRGQERLRCVVSAPRVGQGLAQGCLVGALLRTIAGIVRDGDFVEARRVFKSERRSRLPCGERSGETRSLELTGAE